MATYDAVLVVLGLAVFGAVILPRILADKPLSFPIVYVGLGMALFSLPVGVSVPDPVSHPEVAERLTELVVIIALMGAGLKLDRPFDWSSWSPTWRLLIVVMPLTIAATALLGWGLLGVLPATAILLGAVIAPTDPVLASDVQAGAPLTGIEEDTAPEHQEESVRFALTSEAGLNDGLAFPFTNLAIAVAAAAGASSLVWLAEWALVDLVYRIAAGVLIGYGMGKLLSWVIFKAPSTARLAQVMEGAEGLAATLIAYGVTELVHGYGFIAVFVTALVMRHYEWEHEYYRDLHDFAVVTERLLMAAVLVLFGGAIVGGLLDPLTPLHALVGLVLVFVVRPVAGILGLLGSRLDWTQRFIVSGFGIRGIGSFFYLSFALNEASFREPQLVVAADELWALVGFVVLISIVVHGVAATPVMQAIERIRDRPLAVVGSGDD